MTHGTVHTHQDLHSKCLQAAAGLDLLFLETWQDMFDVYVITLRRAVH